MTIRSARDRRRVKRAFAWMRSRSVKDYPDGYVLIVSGVGYWRLVDCDLPPADRAIISATVSGTGMWMRHVKQAVAMAAKV